MDALVRRARPGDGEAMSRIFDQAARAASTHFLPARGVAEHDNQVVAFAVVRPTQDPDGDPAHTGELDTFYALPSVWGLGVGRTLMGHALEALRARGFEEATLWTAEENRRSRRVYEAPGWRLDAGRRQKTFIGVEFRELR